jgi:hypothetical protein
MKPLDMIGREISVDDFVVFYSNIYQVKALGKPNLMGNGYVKILLVDKSKTTKTVSKYSGDICLIDNNDVLIWKLKGGM